MLKRLASMAEATALPCLVLFLAIKVLRPLLFQDLIIHIANMAELHSMDWNVASLEYIVKKDTDYIR